MRQWFIILMLGGIAGIFAVLLFSVEFPIIDMMEIMRSIRFDRNIATVLIASFVFTFTLVALARN